MKWVKRILLSILGLVLSLILVGFVYEHISRIYVEKHMPIRGKLIDIGEHKLNLNLKGTGKHLVVFESGLDAGGSLVWGQVQDEISKTNSTASYDRAGIMWSERGKNPKTGEAIATELHTLLKKANQNGPYLLVGHSIGGYIVRSFVEKYPGEVLGIVLVDASHPEQFKRFPPEVTAISSTPPEWLAKFVNSIGIVRLFFTGEQYPNTLKTDSINIINNSYLPASLPAVLEEKKNLEEMAKEAGRINTFGNIPLIVITGISENRRNEYPTKELGLKVEKIWMQMQKELLELSTNSEQMLANRSAHFVQLQQPEVVIEAIRKILRQLPDSSKTVKE